MNKVRMNCSYCGRKCSLDKDFCIPQDGVYVCKSCYNWQKKVSDKDMAIENWKTMYESVIQSCRNGIEENKRLEKQLAELKQDYDNLFNGYVEAKKQLSEKDKGISEALAKQSIICLNTIEKAYQDKISFAVERLEKVREKLSSMQWCIDSEKNTLAQIIAHRAKQNDVLDNQIKQLKEGK